MPNIIYFSGDIDYVDNEMYKEDSKLHRGPDGVLIRETILDEKRKINKLWKAYYSKEGKLMNWWDNSGTCDLSKKNWRSLIA